MPKPDLAVNPNPLWVSVGAFRLRHPTPPIDYWLFQSNRIHDYGPRAIRFVHRRVQELWEAGVRYVDFFPTGLNVVGVEAAAEMIRRGMVVRVWYYNQDRSQWFTSDQHGITFWRDNSDSPQEVLV